MSSHLSWKRFFQFNDCSFFILTSLLHFCTFIENLPYIYDNDDYLLPLLPELPLFLLSPVKDPEFLPFPWFCLPFPRFWLMSPRLWFPSSKLGLKLFFFLSLKNPEPLSAFNCSFTDLASSRGDSGLCEPSLRLRAFRGLPLLRYLSSS